MFENVTPPCSPLNAPTSTWPAGRKRNMNAYAKNGSVPTHARENLRPDTRPGRRDSDAALLAMLRPDLAGPLLRDEGLRCGLLTRAGELHLCVQARRRQRCKQRLRDDLPLGEVLEPRRMRVPLQPEQLALVGVEELLPQARRPRVRGMRIDRLCVVGAVDAVGGDGDLPVRRR